MRSTRATSRMSEHGAQDRGLPLSGLTHQKTWPDKNRMNSGRHMNCLPINVPS
jgi:hypothetical protein